MKYKNRWLIALSAVGIHISIGSVYSWSVFSKPIMKEFHWGLSEVSGIFSIAIMLLGLSAAFMGRWVEKRGPRISATVSAIFFASGLIGAGAATRLGSLPLLYLTYGIIGGMGLGIGYISPVSTLVKWFPDRRGLATGLAIMGFGFASLIASPIIANLIPIIGISNTFFLLGSVYFVIMILSASYLSKPPVSWTEMHEAKNNTKKNTSYSELTANEAVKTKRFYFLWLMLFINITCGIAIISVASPMAQEIAGLTAVSAATMVGIMGLFNGAGRIGWASLSDKIGRPNTYITFFIIQIIAFALLPQAKNPIAFQALVLIILTCYGGGFASIPAYIGDMFGTKQLAAIHGYILTAWAAAGVTGPMIVSYVRSTTNAYDKTLYIFVGFFIVALVTSILAKLEINKLKSSNIQKYWWDR
ncbi:MAG: OFA family MFS transporter [Patescibacteria group bacterium]